MSFSKTLELRSQCQENEQKLKMVKDAPKKISHYKEKLAALESLIGENLNDMNLQEELLSKVSQYCESNRLILKKMPEVHRYRSQQFVFETSTVTVEGTFVGILKLIYTLEQQFLLGKVTSVYFLSELDFKTQRRNLYGIIYIQNLKQEKNEI